MGVALGVLRHAHLIQHVHGPVAGLVLRALEQAEGHVVDDAQMRKQGGGTIVNISSVAGKRAIPLGGVAYNASKFAMTALGTTVGEEEKEHGIRVTNIYPGEVETPILDARPVPVSVEHRAKILQPEDVASAVLLACTLPARARIPELVIVPTTQSFV